VPRRDGEPDFEVSMKTCLVVDDSEVVRKVACTIFEKFEIEAGEAGDCQQALDCCAKAMPDAILLDAHLPGMGTVEFLASLRGLSNGGKPIVIYMATENNSSDIMRALSSGADDYLMKPFDREALRKKLADGGIL
jgi:two-component system chemotaxis response regulator CheY